jgi:hypothetical protein
VLFVSERLRELDDYDLAEELEEAVLASFRGTSVAHILMVSGHKTRSVFEQYNIVNDDDLKRAAQMHQSSLEKQGVMGTVRCKKG